MYFGEKEEEMLLGIEVHLTIEEDRRHMVDLEIYFQPPRQHE